MKIETMIGPTIEMDLHEFANELRIEADSSCPSLRNTILREGANDIDAMLAENTFLRRKLENC